MTLETERLILRPLTIDDKNEIFAYRRDKVINKYQSWIPETIEDVELFIGKISDQINVPETWSQFVIVDKKTKNIVGDLGVHFIGIDDKQAELGCTLNKKFQNKGFATEALNKVIDFLFNELNKHRIITSIDPENKNAIRLMQRIGFRKEAHFIESLFINGKWVDDIIYAIIEKDWNRKG